MLKNRYIQAFISASLSILPMILINENIRDEVMSAINKAAGIETPGQGVIFALPVDNVAGLKFE